jgi:hypothetical protein
MCVVGIGSFLGAAAGGVALGEHVDVVAVVQWGVGILAVALLPVLERPAWRDLRSSILWSKSGPTVRRRLRALFGLRVTLFLAVAGVGLSVKPSVSIVAVFACATGFLFAVHWIVASHLDEPCQAQTGSGDTEPQAGRQRFQFLPPKGPEAPGTVVWFFPRVLDILLELLRKAWKVQLPVTLGTGLLAGSSVACVVAFTIGVITPRREDNNKSKQSSASTAKRAHAYQQAHTQTTTQAQQTPIPEPVPTTPTSSAKPAWDGTCPSPPVQTEAREPAISSIMKMYEPGTPPTQPEKGCMGHIYPKHFHREFYATMTGAEPGTQIPLSLCVDSEAFGAAIFLWAVAPKIEELMTEVGPVGGPPVKGGRFPHYSVSEFGEVYLANTRKGVFMFVRKAPSENWVKLVPTEVRALLGAMKDYGRHWLWPSQPKSGAQGSKIVELRYGSDEKPLATITLKSDGMAYRGRFNYPPYPIKEPSVKELEELALTAR